MSRISRKNLKVFAGDAVNNGVFGSFQAGNPTVTNDVEQIQSLPAWDAGWNSATMTSKKLPPLQEFQAVQYVGSYQTAYLLQEGVAEWDSSTTYYEGSWVKSKATGEWKLYQSLENQNAGNAVTDTSKWQSVSFGGGLEVGDIGIALVVDESQNRRRYLNGQVISQTQFPAFANKIKAAIAKYPSLGTVESLWQQAVASSDVGQCGQFVVDEVSGTIRLPKVVNIQGLQTLAGNLGTTVSAGLPNITGEIQVRAATNQGGSVLAGETGAFSKTTTSVQVNNLGTAQTSGAPTVVLDASQSNAIYGNSNTVQVEAVQYPYFIQVATGGETDVDVTTEIQLSNPFFFGMYQWFQTDPNNASWLSANGSYNARSVYTSYYDWLLGIYNDTGSITGFDVKDTTQAYTDYDFVLNLNDETFRLPTKVRGKTGDSVVGNGNALGITDGSSTIGLQTAWASDQFGSGGGRLPSAKTGLSQPSVLGDTTGTQTRFPEYNKSIGVTTDAEFSGLVTDTTGMSLYFYVGAVVQDADIINAGNILNEIANLKQSVSSLIQEVQEPPQSPVNGVLYVIPE